jgi:hypothetical protein
MEQRPGVMDKNGMTRRNRPDESTKTAKSTFIKAAVVKEAKAIGSYLGRSAACLGRRVIQG